MTYFHMRNLTLSWAMSGFTAEFEMVSGGALTLLSPDKNYLDGTRHQFHLV